MPPYQGFGAVPAPIVRRIYKLVDEGTSYRDAAKQIGCHSNTVQRYLDRRAADPSVSLVIRLRRPIERLRKKGKSYDAIARELSCSRSTVRDCVKRWNIPKPKPPESAATDPSRNRIGTGDEEAIVELLRDGLSHGQVVKRLGFHRHTVRRVADEHGYPPHRCYRDGLKAGEAIELRQLLESGVTYAAIGAKLGRSESGISLHAKRLGFRRRIPRLSEAQLTRLDELVAEGSIYSEIADELDVSESAVSTHARRRARDRGEDPRLRGLSVSKRVELFERFDRGESCESIGRAIGCSSKTVRNYVRRWDRTLEGVIAASPTSTESIVERCLSCGTLVRRPCRVCAVREAASALGGLNQ